jgi:hypothetical protein
VNYVEGAMKKCPVCNSSSNIEQIPYCRKCDWPTGIVAAMPKHPELCQAILDWAIQIYKENIQLKNIQLKNESDSSASVINVEFQDSLDLEPLKLELASLNDRIKAVEDNSSQRSAQTNSVPDISKVVGEIQVIKKAIRDTNGFLEEQNLQNQKLDTYKQQSEKVLAEHQRMLQDLIREQQRQGDELKMVRFSPSARNVNQLLPTTPVVEDLSSSLMTSSNLGVRSSGLGESGLIKEYNASSQEVPKSLRDGSKNVSIADEAVASIRDGNVSNITFKLNRSGNFLIITRGGYCYLVPNKQRRIIPQMYTVAQALYKCAGYSENYQDFRLLKPALVTEESIDCWKLSQQGTLEFI